MKISIISPVYLGEKLVKELVDRLTITLSQITNDYEIILIEDGSPDNSWEQIQLLCGSNEKIKGTKLSRNFGQHYAIAAGLEKATGEWIVVMDCDLQDQPEEIINLYNKAKEGFDYVQAKRKDRKDSWFRKSVSKFFYFILSYLNGYKIDPSIANFGIYNKKVIDAVCQMKEKIRWFPNLVHWVGFDGTTMDVDHSVRVHGKSSYTFKKLLQISIDVFLINSKKPMLIIATCGFLMFMGSLIYSLIIFVRFLSGEITVLGYASIMMSILFCSGIIVFFIGITGLYILKIFEQTQDRPIFIVNKEIN